MKPIRAAAFSHSAQSRLTPVPNWPQLPGHVSLDRVSGVAADSRGMVYVAHRGEHPLLCLYPDGRLHSIVADEAHEKSVSEDLRGPVPVPMEYRHWLHGLHVDPWDNVWITDVGRHLVMRFDPTGTLTLQLGTPGKSGCDACHFYQPTHVCVLPSGDFFVTDGYGNSRVAKFSGNGQFLAEWGGRGIAPGKFHTPHVITVGMDGRLYISDRENDRVQVFDKQGKLLDLWDDLHSVDGLFAARDGFIYGSAGLDNALIQFDSNGRKMQVWAEAGRFNYPHAIYVDLGGAFYVGEISGSRVLKLRCSPHVR